MRKICIENGRIHYFGNTAGYVTGHQAVVDPMFSNEKLKAFLNKQRGIEEVKWQDGVYDRLANGQMEIGSPILKNIRIWQLKPEVNVYMKFISLDKMRSQFGEPDKENYQMIFDGEADTNNLEELYSKFNMGSLPAGYTGHSLSVSDVIELYDEKGSEFHYVDDRGFQAIPFEGSNQIQEQVLEM